MRTAALVLLLGLLVRAQEPPKQPEPEPAPVDVAKVLRESKEFAATCERFRIGWEDGLVRAVGEIAYVGGGPCEYLINVSPAKAHETLVLLDNGPWTSRRRPSPARLDGYATCLNSAFLCAGFKPGKPFSWNEQTRETFPPEGEVVHIYVEWKDADKKPVRARISDLIWNWKTLDIMQPGKLVYTGSTMIDEGPPDHKKWFGAEIERLIVAILNTQTSIIDNIEEGSLDTAGACEAVGIRLPEIATRVTVLFSKKPLDGVTEFPPLEVSDEVKAERKKREEEKKQQTAPQEGVGRGEGK